jgi:hypothetical protein
MFSRYQLAFYRALDERVFYSQRHEGGPTTKLGGGLGLTTDRLQPCVASKVAGVIDTPPSAGDSVSLGRNRLSVFEEGDP